MQKVLPSLLAFPSNSHWTQYEAKAFSASASPAPSPLGPTQGSASFVQTLGKLGSATLNGNSSPIMNSVNSNTNNVLNAPVKESSFANETPDLFVGTAGRKAPQVDCVQQPVNGTLASLKETLNHSTAALKFAPTHGALSLLSFEAGDANAQSRPNKSMQISLLQLEELQQRESLLFSKMKLAVQGRAADQYVAKLSNELQSIYHLKQESLSSLFSFESVEYSNRERESESLGSGDQSTTFGSYLTIVQQPAEIAVANRYLIPAPSLLVNIPQSTFNDSALLVSVSLCYYGADNEVKTLDGKQEVLQGIRKVSVDKTGYVTFSKLKVTEVSSKHRHQSFCLMFTLEEYSNLNGSVRTTSRIRSKPFHVQSRPNKRKRSIGDDNGELQPPEKKLHEVLPRSASTGTLSLLQSSPDRESTMSVMEMCNSDVSRSNILNIDSSSDEASDSESSQQMPTVTRSMSLSDSLSSSSLIPMVSPSYQSPNSSPSLSPITSPKSPFGALSSALTSPSRDSELESTSLSSSTKKLIPRRNSTGSLTALEETETVTSHSSDSNYIDITSLLILPQKEAARRLGISESMLCKRFKECTRRKWPYRYLRKIDKIISMLNLHQKSDGIIPKEDRDKLARLVKERETCLRPVKIRISSYDTMVSEEPSSNTSVIDATSVEEDIPDHIVETLEMLKMQRPMTESNQTITSPKYQQKSTSMAQIFF